MVEAIGSNSGEPGVLTYTSINCIELALKESQNFNPLKYAYNQDMSFSFIPVGTIVKTINISKKTNMILKQNVIFTLVIKLSVLLLTMLDILICGWVSLQMLV